MSAVEEETKSLKNAGEKPTSNNYSINYRTITVFHGQYAVLWFNSCTNISGTIMAI